jgi:hypothetical protein
MRRGADVPGLLPGGLNCGLSIADCRFVEARRTKNADGRSKGEFNGVRTTTAASMGVEQFRAHDSADESVNFDDPGAAADG